MERARVQDKDDWQRNSDIQLQHAVAAAEKAVMLHGLSKCDIDAQLQYQAQQVPSRHHTNGTFAIHHKICDTLNMRMLNEVGST